MKTFSAPQICKALDIPPERLREWMVRDYVKATFPSPGQGKKAEFTIDDAYRIHLFRTMVTDGFSRKKACEYLNIKPVGISSSGETVIVTINFGKIREFVDSRLG